MKYYAVKTGKQTGIFTDWESCKASVNGFSGAEYKSFKTEAEAKVYLAGALDKTVCSDRPYAFVDGSFNPETNVYGYGGFLMVNGTEYILQGHDDDKEQVAMRNVAGEIAGCMAAVTKAFELGLTELDIYYDYQGVESWATGAWKRNKQATKAYYEVMKDAMQKMDIHFIKVKGHSGIEGNERADRLAKDAVGVK